MVSSAERKKQKKGQVTCCPKHTMVWKAQVQSTKNASYPAGLTKRKSLDIRSRAVSHVGPLKKKSSHPTPEPWEILLASIVLRLTFSHISGQILRLVVLVKRDVIEFV